MQRANYLFITGALLGLTNLPLASAQTITAQNDEGLQLEEIVVTAEKREANVQKTSIAMTVFSGEEEAKKGSTSLDAILKSVPSLKLEGHAQGAQVFIRGVGSNMDPTIGDPAVAVSTDGAYSSRSEAILTTLNDVERVEVLRGPQGTLYGRNATGGQVNVITASPKIGVFEGSGRMGFGNYSLFSASGVLNVPVIDSLAMRFAVTREKRDGYLTNGNIDADVWSMRWKTLYQPSDSLSIKPTFEYYQSKGSTVGTVFDPQNRTAPHYNSNPWWDPYTKNENGTQNVNINLLTEVNTAIGKLTVTPTYAHQRSCTGVYLISAPGKGPPVVGPPNEQSTPVNQKIAGQATVGCGGATGGTLNATPGNVGVQDEYTAEVRLNSLESSPIDWTVGLYGYKLKSAVTLLNLSTTTVPTAGGPPPPAFVCGTYASTNLNCVTIVQGERPNDSYAAFVQATFPVTDAFRLVAGGRYNSDSRQENYYVVDFSQSTTSPTVATKKSDEAYHPITWKAGAEYDLATDSMLYATVSTGFKSGGVDMNVVTDANGQVIAGTYKPEKLLSYEIGSKNRFFDNRLQLNGSVYLYRYSNFQVQYGGAASANGSFCNCVQNADTGTMKGAELEVQWLVTANDRLDVTATAEDAKYGTLVISNLSLPPASTWDDGRFANGVLTGTDMANAPKWTANLGYQHTFDVGSGELTVRGDAKASAGYWATVEKYFKNTWQDAYESYDANINYESNVGTWNVNLWGKNLSNDYQVTYAMPFGRQMISNPRTYGVTFGAKF